jgi:hypothetical protein
MAYIQSKYYTWYQELVEKAKDRNWSKETAPCYTEIHHVVPRSLGGTNNSDNLVVLSAKEHYVAHRLLSKFTTGNAKMKMTMALFCMVNLNECKESIQNKARVYEKIRTDYFNLISGENHFNRGLIRTEETKNLIRQKRALQIIPKEVYTKRSEKVKGQIWMNDGVKSYRVKPKDMIEAYNKGYVNGRLTTYIDLEYKNKLKNKSIEQWKKVKESGNKTLKNTLEN